MIPKMNRVYIKKQNEKVFPGSEEMDEFDVLHSTYEHKEQIINTFKELMLMGTNQVQLHDDTKLRNLRMFTQALKSNFQKDPINGLDWMTLHAKEERHHLNDFVPRDVNLIDVLEYVCDCVCAAKARGDGQISKPISLSPEVLSKALENTVILLDENLSVVHS